MLDTCVRCLPGTPDSFPDFDCRTASWVMLCIRSTGSGMAKAACRVDEIILDELWKPRVVALLGANERCVQPTASFTNDNASCIFLDAWVAVGHWSSSLQATAKLLQPVHGVLLDVFLPSTLKKAHGGQCEHVEEDSIVNAKSPIAKLKNAPDKTRCPG